MVSSDVGVVVIGAGITGLTTAVAIGRLGVPVLIVERDAALRESGTALSLWPNALAALGRIGLSRPIREIGSEEPDGVICEWTGRQILRLDQSRLDRRLGMPTLVVHRADLQSVLLGAAEGIPMRLGTSVERVRAEGDRCAVDLSNGEQLRASVVLGCDGIHSVTRQMTTNPPPRYTGRTSWRAVLDDASDLVSEARLSVGRGKQFITSCMSGGRIYWAADVAMPEGANRALSDKKAFLLESFAGWHEPTSELIDRTTEEQLVTADIYDSVPRTLAVGRVALLGDAAHPMTPDLGQGACQGIEDGVVLADCMARAADPVAALADYQRIRLRRVRSMVRESRRIGQLATMEGDVANLIRNAGVKRIPGWLNRKLIARYASEAAFLASLPGSLPNSQGSA